MPAAQPTAVAHLAGLNWRLNSSTAEPKEKILGIGIPLISRLNTRSRRWHQIDFSTDQNDL